MQESLYTCSWFCSTLLPSHIYVFISIFQFIVLMCVVNTMQCVTRISRATDKIQNLVVYFFCSMFVSFIQGF